jgi:predicted Fe-Mo cluster-binding NifX family protein
MKKIAVTYENGEVFQHFGHTPAFKIYAVEDGAITASTVLPTGESGHGALAAILAGIGVDILLCGGIGAGARTALTQHGILLFSGVQGNADESVAALLNGTLLFDPDYVCNHHDHSEGHTCGEHGCGGHEDGHTCGSCHH